MTMRRITGPKAAISCTGRVRRSDRLELGTLVELARLRPNGDIGVEMLDLLAAVGLEREAEVVRFTDAADSQLAVPVRELMQNGRLVLGTIDDLMDLPISLSARLELPGWTEADEPFRPVAMSAWTFQEFVQGR